MIYFAHHFNTTNIGDLSCCPADYFAFPPHVRVELQDIHTIKDIVTESDTVIVGGGGVFHMVDQMRTVEKLRSHKVLWGVGTNTHGGEALDYAGVDLSAFDLVGLRDRGSADFVPCVSCMSPLFDNPPEATHDTVAYLHHEHDADLDWPKMTNNAASMAEAVAFLASGRSVVTNSYHGWYWGNLLGREVTVCRSWSSKFHHLCRIGPGSLVVARNANVAFRDRIECVLRLCL